jgi:hypothetical protein
MSPKIAEGSHPAVPNLYRNHSLVSCLISFVAIPPIDGTSNMTLTVIVNFNTSEKGLIRSNMSTKVSSLERTSLVAWGMWALQWLVRKGRVGYVLTEGVGLQQNSHFWGRILSIKVKEPEEFTN